MAQPDLVRPDPMAEPEPMMEPGFSDAVDMGEQLRVCDRYDPLFVAAARRWSPWGMKTEGARWLKAQAFRESSCRPAVCSDKGACGLMQHLEGTARDMGITDRSDPVQSVEGGARYMAWLYGQYRAHDRTPVQRTRNALDSYVRGLGNTLAAQRKWGCVLWASCFRRYAPEEVRTYVDSISALAGHPVEG